MNDSQVRVKVIFSLAIFTFILMILTPKANATAAFARATGASCKKCHTVNFPRLNARGEKFMLNGFQVKKKASAEGGFGLDDDETPAAGHKAKLPDIAEVLSVTGQFNVAQVDFDKSTPALGEAKVVSFTATGSLAKDTPLWAGVDVNSDGASLHRYQLGKTNVADSKKLNFRIGTLDPTTWTSVYGHGVMIESASASIGANGTGHGVETGFTTVGSGYAERNAFEYYGYTKSFLWSFALSNESGHGHGGTSNDALDYWVTGKYSFMKNSSVSLLWYNANGSTENQTYTLGGNLRLGNLDLMSQFSIDNTGGKVVVDGDSKTLRDKWGLMFQANYEVTKEVMTIARYDSTENGEKESSLESHMTLALVYKPAQNIKVTASYVAELETVAANVVSGGGDGHSDHAHSGIVARAGDHGDDGGDHAADTVTSSASRFGDHFLLNVRYMF